MNSAPGTAPSNVFELELKRQDKHVSIIVVDTKTSTNNKMQFSIKDPQYTNEVGLTDLHENVYIKDLLDSNIFSQSVHAFYKVCLQVHGWEVELL